MRRAVMLAWVDFNSDLEGLTTWPYQDAKGLVTCGLGNLVDPVEFAVVLPWVMPDGSLAREDQIRGAWNTVKRQGADKRQIGGGQAFWRDLTPIRLPRPAIDALVRRKLLANESVLASRFSHWHAWPADAHLAVHSMAWAMGPAFHFPKFCQAAEENDFATMCAECEMNPQQPDETDKQYHDRVGTLIVRNARNRACFENAARVVAEGLNPEQLLWTKAAA